MQSGYAKLMFPAIRVFLADYDFQVMGGNCSSPPAPSSSLSDLLPSSIIRTLVGRNVSYRELHHHCTLHLQSALLNASNAINIIIIFLLLLASICSTSGGKGCSLFMDQMNTPNFLALSTFFRGEKCLILEAIRTLEERCHGRYL